MTMRIAVLLVVSSVLLAGCPTQPRREAPPPIASQLTVVASNVEPAAQFDAEGGGLNTGAVVGGVGGAGVGAAMGQASAGLLCTIGGPLCLVYVIPAAIVGGLVGGVAGGVIDSATSDIGGKIAKAREEITQQVAELRITEALAREASARLPAAPSENILEIEATRLEFLPRDKDMAIAVEARARLVRGGKVVEEKTASAQTDYRKYADLAGNVRGEVEPLVAKLAGELVADYREIRASRR
jgi:hypothetical protein